MSKIKSIALIAWGILTALFYVLLKSKDRKIEKQKTEIEKVTKDKEALKGVIHGAEQDAKKLQSIKKDIRACPAFCVNSFSINNQLLDYQSES